MAAFLTSSFSLPWRSSSSTLLCSKCAPRGLCTARSIRKSRRMPTILCCTQSNSLQQINEQLIKSAMLGDTSSVVRLLSIGASPSYGSSEGNSHMTGLMWAAAEGHAQMAEALVHAGADVNAMGSNGYTALLFAVENLPSTNPREPPPPGYPGRSDAPQPPQNAIYARVTGHTTIVRLLLENGADISIKNTSKESLVHMTARKAQIGVLKQLVARGLKVDEYSSGMRETPLHVAAREGHKDVVRVLYEMGADIESTNYLGWTPLLWAAASGWESVARELIDCGAKVNIKVQSGSGLTTPLKEARKCSRPETMSKLLVRAGALE